MPETPQNWFKNNPWKVRCILIGGLFLLMEITLRMAAWMGLFPYQMYPTTHNPVYWDDINPHFGVWKYPNASFNQKASCFNVTYTSNSYGSRDKERSKSSNGKKRVLLLGDSYVEGYGNPSSHRFGDILEKQTGVEFLNFGTSGHFGTIQQWQLYEHLASKFDHNIICIFMLPFNDFSDNNPDDFPRERYRPYLKKQSDKFELYYTVDFEKRKKDFRRTSKVIKNTIDNTFYLANFLRLATRVIKNKTGLKKNKETPPPSYDTYSQEDIDKVLYSYHQIQQLARNKKIYIFTIPAYRDYYAAIHGKKSFKIHKDLNDFTRNDPSLTYVDLLPFFIKYIKENKLTYADITLGCDGHWGKTGHEIAAAAVKQALNL